MIEAEGMAKRFGSAQALACVDLLAEQGKALALLGPDGAGRTLVRIPATDRAYAPYSKLHVGAAVRASDRTVYAGVVYAVCGLVLWLKARRLQPSGAA
jgi:ABC-type nitrate/sulfonate/bicarbonate transport system ATPase subunit